MRPIERRFTYSADTPPITIEGFGDWHIGNICSSDRGLKRVVKEIETSDNAWWIGMGDYFDAITSTDKRFKTGIVHPDIVGNEDFIDTQFKMGLDLVKPIKNKCLGILDGNHEETLLKNANTNLAKRLADSLDAPYLGYESFITLLFTHSGGGRTRTVDIYASHGHGGGRKPGAKINRLVEIGANYPADFIFMGHSHEMLTHATPYLVPDKSGRIRHQHRVGQISGSYLLKHTEPEHNATTYVERAGFPPVAIGRTWVTYNPATGRKSWHGWVDDD